MTFKLYSTKRVNRRKTSPFSCSFLIHEILLPWISRVFIVEIHWWICLLCENNFLKDFESRAKSILILPFVTRYFKQFMPKLESPRNLCSNTSQRLHEVKKWNMVLICFKFSTKVCTIESRMKLHGATKSFPLRYMCLRFSIYEKVFPPTHSGLVRLQARIRKQGCESSDLQTCLFGVRVENTQRTCIAVNIGNKENTQVYASVP